MSSRATRVQVAPQQQADLGGLGVELLDQAPQVVTVARQLRLQLVEFAGQDRLDDMAAMGLAPISNPASNARTRCWPICSGVFSFAPSSVAASSVRTSSGVTPSSSDALNTQSM